MNRVHHAKAPSTGLFVLVCAICAVSPALATPVQADWLIETRTRLEDPSGRALERSGRLIFDTNHLRMEFSDGPKLDAGSRTIVLFDAVGQSIRAVDDTRHSYVQLDRAEIEALARRIARARSEMEARLPELQPEEQKMVRQMIRDMSPGPIKAGPEERLVAQAETRVFEGQTATLHDLLIEDRLVGEVWVASPGAFGLQRTDLAVFRAFSRFQAELISSLGIAAARSFGGEPLALFDRVEGLPLLVRRIEGARVESETRFGPVREVAPDDTRYRVPEDYVRSAGPGASPPPPGLE